MAIPNNVFLIGPGFIGRAVIDELLQANYSVTALVRREAAAKDLESIGVQSVYGELSSKDVIRSTVLSSDIIIHTATADDMDSVLAVLSGIRERATNNKSTIYIHTSGTSFLSDDSKSGYMTEAVYHDSNPEELDALPDSASHRLIDLEILKARKELKDKAKIFIVLPPLIFGCIESHGRLSIQVPTMARFALKHKYPGHVGAGKGVWSTVHVADLARAYLLILQWAQKSPATVALENPYFFCENGREISWEGIAAMIGKHLQPLGRVKAQQTHEIPESQHVDLFGPYSFVVIGANSRSRAERVRRLGWTPREREIEEAFEVEELPLLLEETDEFHGYGKAAASGATG